METVPLVPMQCTALHCDYSHGVLIFDPSPSDLSSLSISQKLQSYDSNSLWEGPSALNLKFNLSKSKLFPLNSGDSSVNIYPLFQSLKFESLDNL
jgi:hypothetical protein